MSALLEPRQIEPSRLGYRRYLAGTLTLIERAPRRWAVRDLTAHAPVRYLSADGEWSTNGGHGLEWESAYWHDFGTAVRLASEAQSMGGAA